MAVDPNEDPFKSLGGGVRLANGDWVMKGMAGSEGPQWGSQPGQQPSGQAPAGTPGATTVQQQAQNAQTYSATPGAAPTQNTTNQGTQDVVRNTYLQQATQGTQIDRNDPVIRQQVDAFSAQQERARRQHESEAAERMSAQGLGNSGAMENERRFAAERAGMASGSFEAQLVGRELQNRRAEIQNALGALSGQISGDQARALQMELAQIDAQLKEAGIDLQGRDLSLRDKLGTGALNVDLLRALLQNQQFGDTLGFNVADREMFWNNQALQTLL